MKKKRLRFTFYKGLALVFLSGVLVIMIILLLLYNRLGNYEKEVQASRTSKSLSREAALLSRSAAEVSATLSFEEEIRLSKEAEEREAERIAAELAAKTAVTDEERAAIEKRSTNFIKDYAMFSLRGEEDLRSKVLSYVLKDSDLRTRLYNYENEWTRNFSNPTYDQIDVTNVKRSVDDPNDFSCTMNCILVTTVAGERRPFYLDFNLFYKKDPGSGAYMLYDMQGFQR